MDFKKKLIFILLLLSLILFAVSAVSADEHYFNEVETAINNPDPEGNVYLNNTTYVSKGSEIEISKSDIVIYGGTVDDKTKTSTLDAKGLSGIITISTRNITFIGINFINGKTEEGSAIDFTGRGSVSACLYNCTFTNNTAYNSGGAIWIGTSENSILWNCTFTNNTASVSGGAIYFEDSVNNTWTNCTFLNNSAKGGGALEGGGAIHIGYKGKNNIWKNCIFINNNASACIGGAIFIRLTLNNTWRNCIFTNNTAYRGGGAILVYGEYPYLDPGDINYNSLTNCTFTNNSVTQSISSAGAIELDQKANFNITFCTFTNNTAYKSAGAMWLGAGSYNVNYCIFDGNNANQGKAIYSEHPFTCNNVFFGVRNMSLDELYIRDIVSNVPDNIINLVCLKFVIEGESFKLKFINTNSEDVTDLMPYYEAKVLINGTEPITVPVNVDKNMKFNSLLAKSKITDFELDNYNFSNYKSGSFSELYYLISKVTGNKIVLDKDYEYDPDYDQEFMGGIPLIKSNFIIEGNNHYISGDNLTRIFAISGSNIAFNNINFINGNTENGGAIYTTGSNNTWTNCKFTNNTATTGGAIYLNTDSDNNIWTNCKFTNNTATTGGAIYFNSASDNNRWTKCEFTNNTANSGGAIYFYNTKAATNNNNSWFDSSFIENGKTGKNGGAIYITGSDNTWYNCKFTNNNVTESGGAIYLSGSNNNLTNCKFTNNTATNAGGAIYLSGSSNILTNCNFTNNKATRNTGGAMQITGSGNNTLTKCTFINNTATNQGGAINIVTGSRTIINNITYCIFENNNASQGKAIHIPNLNALNFNNNFWCTNNTINASEFTNLGLISYRTTNYVPETFIVLNINATGKDYTLYFVFNGTTEDVTSEMPDFNVKVTFNDTNDVNTTMGKHSYPKNIEGNTTIDVYSLFTGNLLAETQAEIIPTPTPVPPVYELKGYDIIKFVNGTECYIVTLTADGKPLAGQEILITLNGEEYTRVTDKNGIATLDLDLPVGTYTVTAKWHRFTTKNTITVKPNPVSYELTAEDLTKYFGGPERYTVTLTENGKPLAGETITITVIGKSYTRVTDENGTASLGINLSPGVYNITATWNNLTLKNTATVKTTIHAENFTKYYLNGTQYEAYVTDSEGNPLDNVNITFNIVGVFYTRTAHNGVVKLNINLSPGEYIITAYNDVTGEASSATVTVLPTLVGSDLNMTYKDGSEYECKLVDGQGNPVKDAEITFNIVGIFYHKTTDDKGIARLDINLLPGEYIITAIYRNTMTSNTITVREL